jgi:hypothetical protein
MNSHRYLQSGKGLALTLIATALLLGAAGWCLLNQQFLRDYVSYQSYRPSSQVTHIVQATSMTDAAKFTFYATHPEVNGSNEFNADCRQKEKGNAILGCYTRDRIYIYDVTDTRLSGVREVTAAHEMLHAAYARLPASKKREVNAQLRQHYESMKDAELTRRMEYYQRTEPGEEDNELHSILGTEFAKLPPMLEDYYRQYFTNRAAVVALHDGYNEKFRQNEAHRAALKSELDSLKTTIEERSKDYSQQNMRLNSDIQQFNTRAEAGDFSSQASFTASRRTLVARSDELTAMRTSIQGMVDSYEQKRTEYNTLVEESNDLQKSLDSSLAPASSL